MAWAEVGKVSIFISGSIQTNPEKMSLSCNPDIKQAFAQALTQVCSESPPQAISPAPTKTYHLHQHSSHPTKTVPGSLGPGGCGFSPQALVLCGPSSLLLLLLFFFFFFFWPPCMFLVVSRLGVDSELQLPAYTTVSATPDLSLVCDLHHSSRQHWILTH